MLGGAYDGGETISTVRLVISDLARLIRRAFANALHAGALAHRPRAMLQPISSAARQEPWPSGEACLLVHRVGPAVWLVTCCPISVAMQQRHRGQRGARPRLVCRACSHCGRYQGRACQSLSDPCCVVASIVRSLLRDGKPPPQGI